MRIRRNILATAILTLGTLGAVAAPVLAVTATPAVAAAGANASPGAFCYHGCA